MADKTYKLKKPMMLTKDGSKAVPAGHPDGATWLGLAGAEIPYEQAKALGLVKPPAKKKPAADK